MDLEQRRDIYSKAIQVHDGDSNKPKQSALNKLEENSDRTHSREFTLTRREFEELVQETYDMDSPYDIECRFLLFLAGKLGLRSGEIAHIQEDWVKWKEGLIEIPNYSNCNKGKRDGEVCGNCRMLSKRKLRRNNLTIEEARDAVYFHFSEEEIAGFSKKEISNIIMNLREDVNLTYEEVISECWSPKTERGARTIPFDFDIRIEMVLEEFFEKYNCWDKSKCTINRRIDRTKECSDLSKRIFPHALRATAASFHAARNISAHSLMSMMGWGDIGTARAYINSNEQKAQKEIRSKYR
jgi:integrase